MPTLSRKTHRASKKYICNFCYKTIIKGEQYHRLFGMAFIGDKPYEVFMCDCCNISKVDENKKVGKEQIKHENTI